MSNFVLLGTVHHNHAAMGLGKIHRKNIEVQHIANNSHKSS